MTICPKSIFYVDPIETVNPFHLVEILDNQFYLVHFWYHVLEVYVLVKFLSIF